MANLEALTLDEEGDGEGDYRIICNSSGKMSPKDRYTDCATCSPVEGYRANGQEGSCSPHH